MAIVSLSLNTETKDLVMTMDGNIIPVDECGMDKWQYKTEDGSMKTEVNFWYTSVKKNEQGLEQRVTYRLAADGSAMTESTDMDLPKVAAETVAFLLKKSNCE